MQDKWPNGRVVSLLPPDKNTHFSPFSEAISLNFYVKLHCRSSLRPMFRVLSKSVQVFESYSWKSLPQPTKLIAILFFAPVINDIFSVAESNAAESSGDGQTPVRSAIQLATSGRSRRLYDWPTTPPTSRNYQSTRSWHRMPPTAPGRHRGIDPTISSPSRTGCSWKQIWTLNGRTLAWTFLAVRRRSTEVRRWQPQAGLGRTSRWSSPRRGWRSVGRPLSGRTPPSADPGSRLDEREVRRECMIWEPSCPVVCRQGFYGLRPELRVGSAEVSAASNQRRRRSGTSDTVRTAPGFGFDLAAEPLGIRPSPGCRRRGRRWLEDGRTRGTDRAVQFDSGVGRPSGTRRLAASRQSAVTPLGRSTAPRREDRRAETGGCPCDDCRAVWPDKVWRSVTSASASEWERQSLPSPTVWCRFRYDVSTGCSNTRRK